MQKDELHFWLRCSSIIRLMGAACVMMVAQVYCYFNDQIYGWPFSGRRVPPPHYASLKEGLKIFYGSALGLAFLGFLCAAMVFFNSEETPRSFNLLVRFIWVLAILCACSSYFGWTFVGKM